MKTILFTFSAFLFTCNSLLGDLTVIAPASATYSPGNSYSWALTMGTAKVRYQQVYDASIFSAYPNGVLIDEIVFRGEETPGIGHYYNGIIYANVHVSTTSKAVDNLSPIFNENVGADNRWVDNTIPISVSGGNGTVEGYGAAIDLTPNSFLYNPRNGNLLLDIQISAYSISTALDAVDSPGDTVSSVLGYSYGDSIPATGTASSLGLVTSIAFQPVPEPSTVLLYMLGLGAFGFVLRKRNRTNH